MKEWLCFPAAMMLLASCTGQNGETAKTPDQQAKELMTQVVSCFENGDKAGLKQLFSEHVIQTDEELDGALDSAFALIDGKITSYDPPFGSAMGSHEQKACGGETFHVLTEKGTSYNIAYTGWLTYDSDPSYIGIKGLRVVNATKNEQIPPAERRTVDPDVCILVGEF
ncbi:MAG: DUF5104 domain-containing protein [Oscillospiraceae bacterium]|nr:DUF5104 domain-containing protein [Oscillospiraceae bacterium]